MISKPPRTDNAGLNGFNEEVRSRFNNYINSLVVPVSSLGTGNYMLHGKHVTMQLQATKTAYFEFIVPHSIEQVKEVTIRFIPSGTGTIKYTINMSYGGAGDDENANTQSLVVTSPVSVTDDQISEINLTHPTNLWADIEAGDQVGIEVILDAATTTTDIHVLSLYFKYI